MISQEADKYFLVFAVKMIKPGVSGFTFSICIIQDVLGPVKVMTHSLTAEQSTLSLRLIHFPVSCIVRYGVLREVTYKTLNSRGGKDQSTTNNTIPHQMRCQSMNSAVNLNQRYYNTSKGIIALWV